MSAHCFVCGNVIEADGQLYGVEYKDGWLCDECDYGVVGILAAKEAALDEMRETLEHMHEYILSASSASLRADAFQRYPKAGKMFREIEGLLEKYPKEQK